LHGTVLLSRR